METGYGRPYAKVDSETKQFVTIMRFRCMGFEPFDFAFTGIWIAERV
jgi:hypothetical protein